MLFILRRFFTYVTLAAYLLVAVVAVRVMFPAQVEMTMDTAIFKVFEDAKITVVKTEAVEVPEIKFAAIKFPAAPKKIAHRTVAQKKHFLAKRMAPAPVKLEKNELPFAETIKLQAVYFQGELLSNLVALYKDRPAEKSQVEMIAEKSIDKVEDSVSSTQAASTDIVSDAEPEFFDYQDEAVTTEVSPPVESVQPSSLPETVKVSLPSDKKEEPLVAEEVELTELVAFDYSSAATDLKDNRLPKTSWVSTHKSGSKPAPAAPSRQEEVPAPTPEPIVPDDGGKRGKNTPEPLDTQYPSQMTIQMIGINTKTVNDLRNFEVRFQDDLSEMLEDYGSGKIVINDALASPKMTRSVSLLKPGFIPTNTDLILEEGVGKVLIPAIDADTFHAIQEPYGPNGPTGAVLIELDDQTDIAQLDVPFGNVIKLDGNLKRTESENFRYQLFVGVKAGNALLSYKTADQNVISKIIHIHENETTFDSNFYDETDLGIVQLFQEDLLSKEKSPLIIGSEQVKIFATTKVSEKLNDHTYKMNYGQSLLGSRKYLELNHQAEPVFVGYRSNTELQVPSETFMRYILGSLEGAGLANRCLVQVNLKRKVKDVQVASESVTQSLMTFTQMLDADGKFYDSVSSKTRKIIVVGEAQGSAEVSQDAKINLKITYIDDSVDYVSSYCSPNTYLVEQL